MTQFYLTNLLLIFYGFTIRYVICQALVNNVTNENVLYTYVHSVYPFLERHYIVTVLFNFLVAGLSTIFFCILYHISIQSLHHNFDTLMLSHQKQTGDNCKFFKTDSHSSTHCTHIILVFFASQLELFRIKPVLMCIKANCVFVAIIGVFI